MSQSIALGNVGAVNFNGSSVDVIKLNSSVIWEGVWSAQMTCYARIHPGDSKTGAYQGRGYSTHTGDVLKSWPTTGSLTPNMFNGYKVYMIHHHYWSDGKAGGTELRVSIAGHHPKSFLNTIQLGSVLLTVGANDVTYAGASPHFNNTGADDSFWLGEQWGLFTEWHLFAPQLNNILRGTVTVKLT